MTKRVYFSFQKLNVYMEAKVLVKQVYGLLRLFPSEERYALGDQMRRAVISVPSNLSEGLSRFSPKEQLHYLEIAYGSMSEIVCQLDIASDLLYISEEQYDETMKLCQDIARMLSHMRSLREKQTPNREAEPRISPLTATKGCSNQ